MQGQERFQAELRQLQDYCQEVCQTIANDVESLTTVENVCHNLRSMMGRLFGIAEELGDLRAQGVTMAEESASDVAVSSNGKTLFDCIRTFRRKNVYYDLLVFEEAVKELNRVLHESADLHVIAAAYNGLGHIYAMRKLYAPAIYYFNKVIELYPANSDGYFNLGAAWFDLGSYEEARYYFRQAIYHSPTDWEAHYHLSKTYDKLGDMESANHHLKIARELKYSHPEQIAVTRQIG